QSVKVRSPFHLSTACWPTEADEQYGNVSAVRSPAIAGGVMVDTRSRAVFNVVGFAGSLRRGSYNRALLRAAKELAPPAPHIVIHELDGIPLYNDDLEAAGAPPGVARLREAVRESDALLVATPEYNHGVPGVLKNTIDWLSRPPRNSALD